MSCDSAPAVGTGHLTPKSGSRAFEEKLGKKVLHPLFTTAPDCQQPRCPCAAEGRSEGGVSIHTRQGRASDRSAKWKTPDANSCFGSQPALCGHHRTPWARSFTDNGDLLGSLLGSLGGPKSSHCIWGAFLLHRNGGDAKRPERVGEGWARSCDQSHSHRNKPTPGIWT